MSAQQYGTPSFTFGLTAETNVPGVIQNLSVTHEVEEAEVTDNSGCVVAFTQYNNTYTVSGEFVYDSSDAAANPFGLPGSADASLAIDDSDISALGTLYINNAEMSKANNEYTTVTFEGKIRPNLGTA